MKTEGSIGSFDLLFGFATWKHLPSRHALRQHSIERLEERARQVLVSGTDGETVHLESLAC